MTKSRRDFLGQSVGSVAAASLYAAAGVAADSSDRQEEPMPVAIIGPGGMGMAHVNQLVGNSSVRLAYVCDVDSDRAAKAAETIMQKTGHAPQVVSDMRRVLDDRAIKAVWIATPDHWHAPAAILAANAGKHVYVEKPCSHNLREGRLMIEAARKNNVVMQVGTQSRSTPFIAAALEKMNSGIIGEILVAKAWNSQLRGSIGRQTPSQPPRNLDYDLWLGPVTERPYQSNFLPGIWRWWYDFGCGDIGNDGVHDIDIARWGLGVTTHPSRIAALGGKCFFDDDQQHADTQYVAFEYPGASRSGRPQQLVYEQRIWSPYVQEGFENGNAFFGTSGMMIMGKSGRFRLTGPKNKLIEESSGAGPDLAAHHQNFLDCIRTGKRPNADIEINHLSTSLCHLANIATRTGRVLNFDPATETIRDDAEASQLLSREYREHWAKPAASL
ncbi:Gfo/Idh/MocA family protein [Schlesneria sp.]|uniref:Gfo/Idh/MocA family protein n=1 Tax=Schlesneria sp. TaxID=2762018 RepID=UPI002EE636AD